MKKLFTIALALVLTCNLVACGCQAQETKPATTAPTTTPTTESTQAQTDETMDNGNGPMPTDSARGRSGMHGNTNSGMNGNTGTGIGSGITGGITG